MSKQVDLDELEALENGVGPLGGRATPAPWFPNDNGCDIDGGGPEYSIFHKDSFVTGSMSIQDAYLITTTRNAMPALIAELRALRAFKIWWEDKKIAKFPGTKCDGIAECGGACCLLLGHRSEHSCSGDEEGPDTCPA